MVGRLGRLGRGIPLKSVETPVAKRPREATAREPPRSAKVGSWYVSVVGITKGGIRRS